MNPKKLRKTADRNLQREVGEVVEDGVRYRAVSLLKERYRIDELLAAGGFGVIYAGCDRRMYDKKVLIKTNRYPRKLFEVQNNLAVAEQVERQRMRLMFERKMLLRAAAGASGACRSCSRKSRTSASTSTAPTGTKTAIPTIFWNRA